MNVKSRNLGIKYRVKRNPGRRTKTVSILSGPNKGRQIIERRGLKAGSAGHLGKPSGVTGLGGQIHENFGVTHRGTTKAALRRIRGLKENK